MHFVSAVNSYRACPLRLPHRSTFPIWRTIMSGAKGQPQTVWVMWERNGGRGDITLYLKISVLRKRCITWLRRALTLYFSSPEWNQKHVILDELCKCKADLLAKQQTCHVKYGTRQRLMAFNNREQFDLNNRLEKKGSISHLRVSESCQLQWNILQTFIWEAFDNLRLAGCLTAYFKQWQENANGCT